MKPTTLTLSRKMSLNSDEIAWTSSSCASCAFDHPGQMMKSDCVSDHHGQRRQSDRAWTLEETYLPSCWPTRAQLLESGVVEVSAES